MRTRRLGAPPRRLGPVTFSLAFGTTLGSSEELDFVAAGRERRQQTGVPIG